MNTYGFVCVSVSVIIQDIVISVENVFKSPILGTTVLWHTHKHTYTTVALPGIAVSLSST